jgi:hypothetical protein
MQEMGRGIPETEYVLMMGRGIPETEYVLMSGA